MSGAALLGRVLENSDLKDRLFATRILSSDLAAPLTPEDQVVQSMPDASPAKWHLAHTTWFFETFVLDRLPGYRLFDPAFGFCFNSYYEAEGPRHPRALRGLLTRPSVDEVRAYRAHVDAMLHELFRRGLARGELAATIDLGIHHEQQHQELLLMDILSLFALHPQRPAYSPDGAKMLSATAGPLDFIGVPGGVHEVGHAQVGFAFDNEAPRHRALLADCQLAARLTTNGEWLEFMADGGYETPSLWLSDGWATARSEGWRAPHYFEERDGVWMRMGLEGLHTVDLAAPVCHVSYFEADAFARWAGMRLPTEFEWEVAAQAVDPHESPGERRLAPSAAQSRGLRQMFGEVWQWTQSSYQPYPGYRPPPGAIGEYNGKFMVSQQVLRGSSFATPPGHHRSTYRNFFYPHQRWQFAGVRLAKDPN